MFGYHHPALKQLADQQVRFAPTHRRLEQLTRAQKLLGEIDPARDYPYQFVCYRITDFRPDSYPDLLIPGAMLQHDLSLLIEALGSGLPLAEKGEPLVALGELARQWNVSTRTIRRWRKLGLAGRRVIKEGKRQVCFQQSVVERFLDQNQDRVRRGSQFTQISDHEREQILETARELAQEQGSTLTKVSRSLAVQVGRSVEAIRYTIRNHDKTHPEQALFPTFSGPLDLKMKESIYSSYRRGIAVNTLAKTFQKTRTSVYRAINEVRAQNLLAQAIEYIMHPDFEKPEMEATILAPMPGLAEYDAKRLAMKAPRDVLPELAVCYEYPLLDAKQEQHLFRQMNYLKFKAARLRDRLQPDDSVGHIDPTRIRSQLLDQIESLLDQAQQVKGMLINANMRLVVNIVKKHNGQNNNFFELLSDGNMSLIRAVEKFDYGRGFKFSTYASWAIIKNFARTIPDEKNQRERFVTGHEDLFELAPDNRADEIEMVASKERATHSVNRLLEFLEPREREIIRMRAGLDNHSKGMTLEEIGEQFGITKERVRQLNARAMKKLRSIAEKEKMDLS